MQLRSMPAVSYHTGAFPPSELDWKRLIPLLGTTSAAIARYDGVLSAIPNPEVLLSPLTTQEAVMSSRIEGTQATIGEVLEFEAGASKPGLSESRREDIGEILNYRKAMREAERQLINYPLSLKVIKAMHAVLLDGVRGKGKAPGEFRKIPNWIGKPGSGIENARFVPIGSDALPDAASSWEKYLHSAQADLLVQLAIAHAEFEALHPFLDGNGRLGRMLIPIFLWQRSLIHRPMFYVSAYLERHRDSYYEKLLSVSRDGDWTGWCSFFLEALREQAEDNLSRAKAIGELYEELKPRVAEITRSQYSIHALDWIFSNPIFRTTSFIEGSNVPEATARRILKELRGSRILVQMMKGSGRRPAAYCCPKLLNIAEGKNFIRE